VWEEILGVAAGPTDNFFDLGGHSLLATQVLVRLADAFHVELPIRTVFFSPTLEELAHEIDQAQSAGTTEPAASIQRLDRRRSVTA
ncbi:MAG: phosphopantetheine-binding protein, partial [Acidimicrobiales bacterium]